MESGHVGRVGKWAFLYSRPLVYVESLKHVDSAVMKYKPRDTHGGRFVGPELEQEQLLKWRFVRFLQANRCDPERSTAGSRKWARRRRHTEA